MNLTQISHLSPAISIAVGILFLIFGRKLFWLFVAVMGFLIGLQFGAQIVAGAQPWMVLVIAGLLGVLGAVLSMVLQKVAVALACGAAAGLVAMQVATDAGFTGPTFLLIFLVSVVVAGLLGLLLFEWALMILSSLAGAMLIVQSVDDWEMTMRALLGLGLVIFGIVVQSQMRTAKIVAD